MRTRGIGVFLALVFGVTAGVTAAGRLWLDMPPALRLALALASLLVPAVAAAAASRLDGAHRPPLRVWPVPVGPALAAAVGIPVVFAILCAGLWAAGVVTPDWETRALMLQIPSAEQLNRSQPLSPSTVVISYLVLSVAAGPTLFALLFLASEIGWRDYFLSRILPVGRVWALLLSGLFWGLWLALLALADPRSEIAVGPFLLRQVAFGVAFGAFVGEAWRRSRHVGLAAVITGCLQAQLQGVWFYLFPESEYLGIGVPATVLWAALALVLIAWPEKGLARDDAPSSGAVARG